MELWWSPLLTVTTRSLLGAAETGDANPARMPANSVKASMLAGDGRNIVFIINSAGEPISAKVRHVRSRWNSFLEVRAPFHPHRADARHSGNSVRDKNSKSHFEQASTGPLAIQQGIAVIDGDQNRTDDHGISERALYD